MIDQQAVTTTEPHLYFSYMLRLWQTVEEGRLVWRASLENPHTGERRGFANLQMLYAFLQEMCAIDDDLAQASGKEHQSGCNN